MKIFELTALHLAAAKGDLTEVKKLLEEKPGLYTMISPSKNTSDKYSDAIRLTNTRATVLHSALKSNPMSSDYFALIKLLLEQPDCNKIINLANDHDEIILSLIVQIKDAATALELTKIALAVKQIEVNPCFPSSYQMPPLAAACGSNVFTMHHVHLDVITLLLERGANPDGMVGYNQRTPLLKNIASKLYTDRENQDLINDVMLLLINKGADPRKTDSQGENFFDEVIGNSAIEPYIDSRIKERFQDRWKRSTLEEVNTARTIYEATNAYSPLSPLSIQNFDIDDVALLISLKKKHSDFECTVCTLVDLESFIKFVQLRFEAVRQPFQTQFVVTTRFYGNHAASGQLTIDEQGQVKVFWIDPEGMSKMFEDEIAAITHQYFPDAIIYSVDEPLQTSDNGSHITAVYIAEQLFAAVKKHNLFADLKKIDEEYGEERKGNRVIPWSRCPVYTGVPKITQSLPMIKTRLKEELKEDSQIYNKKGENYQAEMSRFFGKLAANPVKINKKYETVRIKYGQAVKQIYEDEFKQVNAIRLLSCIDVVNRIPVDDLIKQLAITFNQEGEAWHVSLSGSNNLSYEGTLPELAYIFERLLHDFTDNFYEEIREEQFMRRYAELHACRTKIDILLQANPNTEDTQEKLTLEQEHYPTNRMI